MCGVNEFSLLTNGGGPRRSTSSQVVVSRKLYHFSTGPRDLILEECECPEAPTTFWGFPSDSEVVGVLAKLCSLIDGKSDLSFTFV